MTATLDVYDASTGLLHGQLHLPDNYSGQVHYDTRYLGSLRIECMVQPLPMSGLAGDPVQRVDIQSLGTHIGNMAAATDRQASLLKETVDTFSQVAVSELNMARQERDWWRDRANLLQTQLRLVGARPRPAPPEWQDSF